MTNVSISPELAKALDQFLSRAWRIRAFPRTFKRTHFTYRAARKYIRIYPGPFQYVLFATPSGDLYEGRFRGGWVPNFDRPMGNVLELVKCKDWRTFVKRVETERSSRLVIEFPGTKPLVCDACGRSKPEHYVRETAVGMRCRYCRGSDMRHMSDIRALGGTPRVGARPLQTNADYYRPV